MDYTSLLCGGLGFVWSQVVSIYSRLEKRSAFSLCVHIRMFGLDLKGGLGGFKPNSAYFCNFFFSNLFQDIWYSCNLWSLTCWCFLSRQDAAKVIRDMIQKNPDSLNFNVIAISKKSEGSIWFWWFTAVQVCPAIHDVVGCRLYKTFCGQVKTLGE